MRAHACIAADDGEVKLSDRPEPLPGDSDVLVAMQTFGVGIHDRYFNPLQGPFPYTIGTEGASIVVAEGPAVTAIDVGDRVMMTCVLQPQGGTWAELAVAPEKNRLPDSRGHRFRDRRVEQFEHRPDVRADMAELVDDIAAGHVRVVRERIYDFEDALVAFEKHETRHARGKLVVTVPAQADWRRAW